jgi:hypothetical protein
LGQDTGLGRIFDAAATGLSHHEHAQKSFTAIAQARRNAAPLP